MKDLENAKVGDKLIVSGRWQEGIEVVIKITPAGNIKTKYGIYEPDGRMRGSGIWNGKYARKATDSDILKLKAKIEKAHLVNYLKGVVWKDLEHSVLNEIKKIIDDENNK